MDCTRLYNRDRVTHVTGMDYSKLGTECLVGLRPELACVRLVKAIRTWLQVVGGMHPVAERYMLLSIGCHLVEPASRKVQHLPCNSDVCMVTLVQGCPGHCTCGADLELTDSGSNMMIHICMGNDAKVESYPPAAWHSQ